MGRREHEGVSKAWPKVDVRIAATEVTVEALSYLLVWPCKAEDGEEETSFSSSESRGNRQGTHKGCPYCRKRILRFPGVSVLCFPEYQRSQLTRVRAEIFDD